jgi:hypothetical protein
VKRARTWHAGHMLFALARHFQWFAQKMITECEIGGLREDLVVVSRAGYATVIEIKVTRADWLKDQNKGRWTTPSKHLSRFFYAVPQPVFKQGIPDHVPATAGILVVRDGGTWQGYDSVVEERAAARLKAEKLPETKLRAINEAFYYRFWRQQMDLLRDRFAEKPAKALAA